VGYRVNSKEDVAQHAELHGHDVESLADLVADLHHRLAAAAAQALLFGQGVHDVHARQVGWQHLALAAPTALVSAGAGSSTASSSCVVVAASASASSNSRP
jgi:galactose-1-phosphate uridylyltransferase